MAEKWCTCPYVICPVYGNCEACVAKSMKEGSLVNCMERVAQDHYGLEIPLKEIKTEVRIDYEDLSLRSAEAIVSVLKQKPNALFCLAAGDTAIGTYKILKEMSDRKEIDFSSARFVALDDWLGLSNKEGNCNFFMMKYFYNPLGIQKEQMMLFDLDASDIKKECLRIDDYISKDGPIDFMLLGMGMNGHLGLNEPGVHWNQYSIEVELDSVTKDVGQKYFNRKVELKRGVTLGMKHILESGQVLLQVSGKRKAEVVRQLNQSHPDFSMPASALKLHKDALLVLDKEAASLVSN